MSAIRKLLFNSECDKRMLFIDHTGGGKSHTVKMIAVMVGGVWLIVVPLLSLTPDVIAKMKEGANSSGSIDVYNLDEIPKGSNQIFNNIVKQITTLPADTNSTVFLFASPQYISGSKAFRDALFLCHKNKTLRGVVIDEVHLVLSN